MYTSEEIERKRLLALQKKAQKLQQVKNKLPEKRKLSTSPLTTHQPKQPRILNTINPVNFFGKSESIKINLVMITEDRFQIEAPYNQELIKLFYKISSKKYDPKTKWWNFHIDDYNNLLQDIRMVFGTKIIISSIPSFVLQAFRNNLRKKSEEKLQVSIEGKIDKILLSQLMPFQKEGVMYGIRNNGNCIIADDMGLGKTIQALGIAHYFQDDWPLLIVTPSVVRYQWSEAIYRFLPSIPAQHVFQFINGKDCLGSERVTIVSYDLLARHIQTFENKVFGFLIIDESHSLKSFKTERTKSVKKIAAQARHVLLLSGTPALSRPIELYSQLSLVCRNFMKVHDYGVRYCEGQQNAFGWDFKGASNIGELQLLLKSTCLIRRMKNDVLKQLPDKIREVVILDPGLIKVATKEMEAMAAHLHKSNGIERHGLLLKYYAESCQQKVLAVENYIKNLVEKQTKFLVFAHHEYMLTKICNILDKSKIIFVKIDGKTKADDRKLFVDKFQECDSCLVAVLSITAANAGITLTAASLVVFAELYWNPGTLCQAEDRVHRIGQKNSVIIQYLIAKGTVDDFLWPLLQSKTEFLVDAGLNQNFSFNETELTHQKLTGEDLALSNSIVKQQTLDDFVISQELQSNMGSNSSCPVNELPRTSTFDSSLLLDSTKDKNLSSTVVRPSISENLSQLLDDDDSSFVNFDFSNIV